MELVSSNLAVCHRVSKRILFWCLLIKMATAVQEDGASFKCEKLVADNYHSWKFNMKMYLMGRDLWDIVQGTEVVEEDANAENLRKFKKRENLALASICLSVSTGLQIYVRNAKSCREAWKSLSDNFEKKTLSKKIFLQT